MSVAGKEWQAAYSVGNEVLDAQHQQLLLLCQEVEACIEDAEASERLDNILAELARYARNHFATEEALLAQAKYAGLAAQQEEHREYDENITAFLVSATFRNVKKTKIKAALGKYLEAWWLKHILVADMQYKKHLQAAETAGRGGA